MRKILNSIPRRLRWFCEYFIYERYKCKIKKLPDKWFDKEGNLIPNA